MVSTSDPHPHIIGANNRLTPLFSPCCCCCPKTGLDPLIIVTPGSWSQSSASSHSWSWSQTWSSSHIWTWSVCLPDLVKFFRAVWSAGGGGRGRGDLRWWSPLCCPAWQWARSIRISPFVKTKLFLNPCLPEQQATLAGVQNHIFSDKIASAFYNIH